MCMSEKRFLGVFGAIAPLNHYGELTVNGEETGLSLIGDDLSEISTEEIIYGQTTRGSVSCIHCISSSAQWTFDGMSRPEQLKIFPHYVIYGARFFDPKADTITRMTFRFTDIDVLFGDSGHVGSFMASQDLMKSILLEARKDSEEILGDTPVVSYFNGQVEFWGLQTAIGRISVRNVVELETLRPFTHHLEMSITFATPLDFNKSIQRINQIRQCMTVMAGRAQRLEAIKLVMHVADSPAPSRLPRLNLEWCLSPKGPSESDFAPRSFALPLDPLRRSEEFSSVITGWFDRDEAWHWPRSRYVEGLEHSRSYSADRLIAAANMFDLLPDSAYSPPAELDPEIIEAAAQTKKLFQSLPNSIEKSSVLSTLGRFGKHSLPKKLIQRGDIVLSHLDARLPSLQKVLKAAVLCRNHLVHGSDFDLDAVEPYVDLMTDSLEFVFIAADLIQLGWDAKAWGQSSHRNGHRFAEFIDAYARSIDGFIKAYKG
jgi:hypothetical protein